jgi:3-dehydroquinate dehydratase II
LTGARSRVEVLHGVNLDMLGKRNPEHYGTLTLIELEVRIRHWARQLGLEVSFFHTNSESEFVERLHQAPELADALLLNPGAWTHYSYAIRDALEIAGRPTVEVHLSDVSAREEWRRHSVLADLVVKRISGKGVEGYREALEVIARELGVPPPAAA